jgi:hypothetical protein
MMYKLMLDTINKLIQMCIAPNPGPEWILNHNHDWVPMHNHEVFLDGQED